MNGETGDYVVLRGAGTFTELQEIDGPVAFSGTGTVTEAGKDAHRLSWPSITDARVGFANSGGLVFVDESAEEIAAA